MNLIEFTKKFQDEQACRDWLATKRWGSVDKAICPHCDCNNVYKFNDGILYKCSKCNKQFTVRINTIFEDSRLPLVKWFLAIYLFTSNKKGISSIQLSKYIQTTQKTAWFILQRLREVMNDGGSSPFDGISEIDEAYLGGKSSNMHMSKRIELKEKDNKQCVLGIVNRDTKQVKAIKVESSKTQDLQEVIYNNVNEGETIITDGYSSYDVLKWNYKHESVNHSKGEYVKQNSREAFKIHTNTIEGFWSLLKRGIDGIYHWASKKHIQKYLNEFSFRYNEGKISDFDRFSTWFSNCQDVRLTYKSLISC
jgi:transposase-like protein